MAIFKKIYIFTFLFFVFLNANSQAEIVNKIDIQGNDRISPETIIIFGDIAIGKNYEESDISLLIKR